MSIKNTSKYIPYDAVVPLLLIDPEHADFPYFSGTGFFVHCPPSEEIFLVTSRHCIFDNNDKLRGDVTVFKEMNEGIIRLNFSHMLETKKENDQFFEDIIVFVVDREFLKKENIKYISSVEVFDHEVVDFLIDHIFKFQEKIRIVGYPSSCKEMTYSPNKVSADARGVVGKIEEYIKEDCIGVVSDLNWDSSDLHGFSGSPVIGLCPNQYSKDVEVIPLGVVVMGADSRFRFVSFNIVTNVILNFISSESGNC
ncbi:hypothetical protein TH9_22120 [Thalassospira xiamenensis]|uniref:hypothetical protein n=1 Tax=Thalassospira xiamenensis TaxID=220697 RepID=UPI000DED79DF|nr:hypothetical protein [Thalassospira xiamenensis]RCK28752.1 hypothetical protein TH9_22120 [Thalassospira xiamenensis]